MLPDGSGSIRIPVTVGGQDREMIIDTGAFWSGIVQSAVPHVQAARSGVLGIGANGGVVNEKISVPEFRIGNLVFRDADFLVLQEGFSNTSKVAGNIGGNILKNYDIEIDQAARRVNFFSQDHCSGHVVHWAFTDLVKIPIDLGKDGRLTIPMVLDGKKLHALIDTGASASQLRADLANDLFNLTPDGPGMEKSGFSTAIDGRRMQQYEHRFGTLTMDGITFKNPNIMITPINLPAGVEKLMKDGMPEFVLGMHQMRNLHLYIAYDEEMLYVSTTAGDAAAGGRAQAAAPVPQIDPVDAINAGKLNDSALKHAAAGEYQAALSDLNNALAIAPRGAWLYANRAFVYRRMGNSDLALKDYAHAIEADPNFEIAYLGRAGFYTEGGNYDAAIADLSKAITISPLKALPATLMRCRLYAMRKDFVSALYDCDSAVNFWPNQAESFEMRGAVRLAAGRVGDALDDFDNALRLDGHRALSLMGRGLARQRKGDKSGARADIAAAEEIAPAAKADFSQLLQPPKIAAASVSTDPGRTISP